MAKRLGVAVIGLGIGEQHARMYAGLPACEVRALVDLDQGRACRLAAEFPNSRVAKTFEDVLMAADIDVVSIASFDDAHFAQVMAAIAAGKHVFVEKPLCRTAAELSDIRRALYLHSNIHLASNLVLRSADLYRWLRDDIAAGGFGEIYAFDGDYLYGRLHKITEGWRSESDSYSVMLGGGIHMIDLMVWLTGQRPDSVQAIGSRLATRGTSFRYDDFSAATLAFPSGLVGRITANFGCMHPHQHVVRIFGTRKTFVLDDAGPRVMASRDRREHETVVPAAQPVALAALPAHKGALIPSFIERIMAGANASTPELAATLDAIAIAIACDRATSSTASVKISYQ